jgi:hypothetical protein
VGRNVLDVLEDFEKVRKRLKCEKILALTHAAGTVEVRREIERQRVRDRETQRDRDRETETETDREKKSR